MSALARRVLGPTVRAGEEDTWRRGPVTPQACEVARYAGGACGTGDMDPKGKKSL
ncbi:hypothetical protein AB0G54_21550 [Streptomyces yokosukanensis]|uniref:hypothetical protein n=1 Tax=Streptomyces yokosukanensis TaxID=67386 RepID=UPI000A88C481|nr:hypothetical protein [Streptomyces yokosukanensis]